MIGSGNVASDGLVFLIDSFNNKSYEIPLVPIFIDDSIPYQSYSFNILSELIYNENLGSPNEWVVSTSTPLTINLSSTNDAFNDITSIEFTNVVQNSTVTFIANTDISNAFKIKYRIKNKSAQTGNRRLRFVLYDITNTQIGNYIEVFNTIYGYNTSNTLWQTIEIPISDFNILSSDQIHKIEIVKIGLSTANIYLDYLFIDYITNPIIIGLSGDLVSDWNTYLALSGNGTVNLSLSGGAITEIYTINSVLYDSLNDITVLYNQGTNLITSSYSCEVDDIWSGGPLYIKVPGVDMSGIFSIYTENNTVPITLHMTGGIDHIETSSITPYYLPLNNIYIPSVSGPKINRWNGYILSNGGSMSLSLNSTIPSIYPVTQSTIDSLGANTLLYSFPDFVTLVKDCYIDSAYTGFDCIVAYGIDFTRSMDLYTQNGTIGLSFSLLNGVIPETYVAASYSYDGSNTYIYRDDSTPTQYNDHSQFEIYVENIVEFSTDCVIDSWATGIQSIIVQNGLDISSSLNLYSKPLSIYLSGGAIPETYVIDTYYFDGFYNYIYDSAGIGTLYNDHTKMTIMKPQVNGEISTPDYTTGTYSVYAHDEDIIVQSGIYFDGTDTYLYDDNGYGLIYTEHTKFELTIHEVIGTLYADHTTIDFSHIVLPPTQVSNIINGQIFPLLGGVGFNNRDFLFDGTSDYINIGNLGNGFTSYTLNLWFNSSSITNFKNILDFNGSNTGLRIEQTTGYSAACLNGTGTVRMGIVLNQLNDLLGIGGDLTKGYNENEWVNIIITNQYDTKHVTLFLNGEKIVDVTTMNFFHGQINNLKIGIGYDSSRFFEGKIPYVGLYNRSLSESECVNNYNSLKWRFI